MSATEGSTSLSFGEALAPSAIFFVSGLKGGGICVGGLSERRSERERTIIVRGALI